MDMEGRSLGTERPPTSTSPGAGHHGASTAAGRFSEYLGSKTSEAASATRGAREEVEDDVAARIRDGRTDAADEVRRRDAAVRDDQQVRDARADAARQDASRQAQRDAEESGSSRRSAGFREGPKGPAGRHGGELSGRERATGWTDAADAEGATVDPEDLTEAPFGPTSAAPLPPSGAGFAPAAGPAGGAPGAPPAAPTAPGLALPATPAAGAASRPPAAATAAGTRVEAAPAGQPSKAAPARPGTSLQRAEAILEQLRIRIQSGEREATINLNPADLGRLRLHVKVDQGSVMASIAAESAETLAVLEAHAPELRAWLARDGAENVELQLGLMTSAEADEQSRFDQRERGGQPGSRRGPRTRDAAPVAGPEGLLRQLAQRTADGGVDLIA